MAAIRDGRTRMDTIESSIAKSDFEASCWIYLVVIDRPGRRHRSSPG